MLVIPAIDIRGGKVVRLSGGDFRRETVYGDDPAETAAEWEAKGAKWLHVVDLDGAREGRAANFEAVCSIAQRVKIPIEVGGGIREMESADRYLDGVAAMVILGTGAYGRGGFMEKALARHGGKIAVSVDSKNGMVAVEGWKTVTRRRAKAVVSELSSRGVENIIFTDIARDGMLSGIDAGLVSEIISLAGRAVTVAGGVSSAEDVRRLRDIGPRGVIIGKALYSGALDFQSALREAGETGEARDV